jgi:hypothetical protein
MMKTPLHKYKRSPSNSAAMLFHRAHKSARKTSKDILEVEQALTNVREEIERMEGRKRFLEDQVSLSTINVNLHEPYPLMASGQYGFWPKCGAASKRASPAFPMC